MCLCTHHKQAALRNLYLALLVVQMTWLVEMKAFMVQIRNVLTKLKYIELIILKFKYLSTTLNNIGNAQYFFPWRWSHSTVGSNFYLHMTHPGLIYSFSYGPLSAEPGVIPMYVWMCPPPNTHTHTKIFLYSK